MVSKHKDVEHKQLACQFPQFSIFVQHLFQRLYLFPRIFKIDVDLLVSKRLNTYCLLKLNFNAFKDLRAFIFLDRLEPLIFLEELRFLESWTTSLLLDITIGLFPCWPISDVHDTRGKIAIEQVACIMCEHLKGCIDTISTTIRVHTSNWFYLRKKAVFIRRLARCGSSKKSSHAQMSLY